MHPTRGLLSHPITVRGRPDTGLTCMLQCVCITHENLVQWLSQVPLSVAMQSVIALQWPWNSSGWLNCGASYKRSGRTIIIMTWYSGLDSWPIKVGKSAMISHSSRHGDFGNDWLLKCHLAEFTCRYRHVLRPSLILTTRIWIEPPAWNTEQSDWRLTQKSLGVRMSWTTSYGCGKPREVHLGPRLSLFGGLVTSTSGNSSLGDKWRTLSLW